MFTHGSIMNLALLGCILLLHVVLGQEAVQYYGNVLQPRQYNGYQDLNHRIHIEHVSTQ